MKNILTIACLVFVSFGDLAAAKDDSRVTKKKLIPDVIWYAHRHDQAAWVSARAAFDASGSLRPEYFPAARRATLSSFAARNADGHCNVNFTQSISHAADKNYGSLVAESNIIVMGDVLGSATGFYSGQPATLVAIAVSDRVRQKSSFTRENIVYIVLPNAKIDTPAGALCSASVADSVQTLEPGDHIMLFAFYTPNDETHAIFEVEPGRDLLVERAATGQLVQNHLAKELGKGARLGTVAAAIKDGAVR